MTSHDEDEAVATERWLDQLDPATVQWQDARWLRATIAAGEALTAAEETLRGAVAAARAAGTSWTALGAALNTTPEVARQRFGELEHEPSPAAADDT